MQRFINSKDMITGNWTIGFVGEGVIYNVIVSLAGNIRIAKERYGRAA